MEPVCPPALEVLRDAEWQEAITAATLERVRGRVRPEHFEIFHLVLELLRRRPAPPTDAIGIGQPPRVVGSVTLPLLKST